MTEPSLFEYPIAYGNGSRWGPNRRLGEEDFTTYLLTHESPE